MYTRLIRANDSWHYGLVLDATVVGGPRLACLAHTSFSIWSMESVARVQGDNAYNQVALDISRMTAFPVNNSILQTSPSLSRGSDLSRGRKARSLSWSHPFKKDLTIEGIEPNPGMAERRRESQSHGQPPNRRQERDQADEAQTRILTTARLRNAIQNEVRQNRSILVLARMLLLNHPVVQLNLRNGTNVREHAESLITQAAPYGPFQIRVTMYQQRLQAIQQQLQYVPHNINAEPDPQVDDSNFRNRMVSLMTRPQSLPGGTVQEARAGAVRAAATYIYRMIHNSPHYIFCYRVLPIELREAVLNVALTTLNLREPNRTNRVAFSPEDLIWLQTEQPNRMEGAVIFLRGMARHARIPITDRDMQHLLTVFFQLDGYAESEAANHNKAMHIANGNIFCEDMRAIHNLSTFAEVIQMYEENLPYFQPSSFLALLHRINIDNPLGAPHLAFQDGITASYVDRNQVRHGNNYINMPTTCLYPIRIYSAAAGELITHRAGLPYMSVRVASYYGHPLKETQIAIAAREQMNLVLNQRLRHTDTHQNGFKVLDLAYLVSSGNTKGLSMEQPMLKLMLLNSILNYQNNAETVPLSTYSQLDTHRNAHLHVDTPPQLEFNSPAVWDPACTDMPFDLDGTLSFHTSLDSVPADERSTAIFLPPSIYNNSAWPEMAIALYVMMFSNYPFGLYTINKPCGEENEYEEFAQMVMMQSLVRITGRSKLRIIMSRRGDLRDPDDDNHANAAVNQRPCFGPEATVGHEPNDPIQISWDPANPHNVSVSQYLRSWALAFSTTEITRMVNTLSCFFAAGALSDLMHEAAVILSYGLPCLTTTAVPDRLDPQNHREYIDSSLRVQNINLGGREVIFAGQSHEDYAFPYQANLTDQFVVLECDINAWNRVACLLATAESSPPDKLAQHCESLGNRRAPHFEHLSALLLSVPWQLFYNHMGITTEAWSNLANNHAWEALQDFTKALFVQNSVGDQFTPPTKEDFLHTIFEFSFQMQLRTQEIKLLNGEIIRSGNYGRFIQPNTYYPVYGWEGNASARFNGYTPVGLIDVWVHHVTRNTPRFAANFPPPGGISAGVAGYCKTEKGGPMMELYNQDGTRLGPYVDSLQPDRAERDVLIDPEDHTKWNERIAVTETQTHFLSRCGLRPLAGTWSLLSLPYQRVSPVRDGTVWPATEEWNNTAAKSTLCIPTYNSMAQRVYPFVAEVHRSNITNCFAERQFLARDSWLIGNVTMKSTIPGYAGTRTKSVWQEVGFRSRRSARAVTDGKQKPQVPEVEIETVPTTGADKQLPTRTEPPVNQEAAAAISSTVDNIAPLDTQNEQT